MPDPLNDRMLTHERRNTEPAAQDWPNAGRARLDDHDSDPCLVGDHTDLGLLRDLENLKKYQAIANFSHEKLQRLAELIAAVFKVPCVSVTLIPETRIVRLAEVGLPENRSAPEQTSFTSYTLRKGVLTSIEDVATHQAFADHPLVVGAPFARSWLSVPLRNDEGVGLGALNIWDSKPRCFSRSEGEQLCAFAEIASSILDLLQTAAECQHTEQLLQQVFDNAAVGMSVHCSDGNRVVVNQVLSDILGFDRQELLSMKLKDLFHPDDREEWCDHWEKFCRGNASRCQYEIRALRKSGEPVWVRLSHSRLHQPGKSNISTIVIVEDIEEHRKAQEMRELLLGEINHRVKNTLGIVQGMARRILNRGDVPETVVQAFERRLGSLARSHERLTNSGWGGMSVKNIILDAHKDNGLEDQDRLNVSLPVVEVNPQTAIMLNLLFSELFTNAVKHGALKNSGGSIDIIGETRLVAGERWLEINWSEHGQSTLPPKQASGYGMYLIERAPKLGLGGTGTVGYADDGLRFQLSFPVYSLVTNPSALPHIHNGDSLNMNKDALTHLKILK